MTTTTPISSTNYNGCHTEPVKPLSRIERTKSFLKASIIKKWKSSKELFTKPISSLTECDKNIKQKQCEIQPQSGKFINEKVLENLDEFERNFLLSAGRKIIVRELRKNFEKPQYVQTQTSCSSRSDVIPLHSTTQLKKPIWVADKNPKQFVNASVQTTPNYEEFGYELKATGPIATHENQKRNPIITRHSSFYNTYRNEYYAWQNNHYASNLSLISYGIPRSSDKCLERTINKYKSSIKSSSAIDLSSISSVVLNSTNSTNLQLSEKSSSNLKHHHSSIVNISHSNSNQNLTDSQFIDAITYATVDERIPNNQLKATCSINSLNTTYSTTVCDDINNTTTNTHVETHIDYDDTNSLIVNSNLPVICSNGQNVSTAGHFQTYVSKTNLYVSNFALDDANMNNIKNKNKNHNENNDVFSVSLNCHNKNVKNTSCSHDKNNNSVTRIRKCHSINQIDLNLLKNELDEYIDREIRTTNFGRNTLAQRRCLFENKVNVNAAI